ncbi:hypothetical protein [Microbispora sp. NBRC 16548]|uniref:hypothetical protein n=1 Tax=Microbispora sp. NBRC 16548 TaxID=3030994 RepID=UPI0024A2FAF5|nr:hypothetical protein [Microbispora sp. NBRC 16548]GLX08797.1 hypothetical protein Misp03_57230 [Microbispora sp. NBRC 16548]
MPTIHTLTGFPDSLARRPTTTAATLALALALPLALALALAAPVAAGAAAAGDGNGNGSAVRVGNGSANRNLVAMGSTHLRGALHQFSAGVGGLSSVQGGLCRPRGRLCALSQDIRATRARATRR